MWNERYSSSEYVYGTEPNDFLKEYSEELLDPVLSLGEGEGRNATFLSENGYGVMAVDFSQVGLDKAKRLARSRGQDIETLEADLREFDPGVYSFSSVVSIFAHLPSKDRRALYQRVAYSLPAGGRVLLEAYTPAQVGRGTGGPPETDLCVGAEDLRNDFKGFRFHILREREREVVEGRYHTGTASVVQMLAEKG